MHGARLLPDVLHDVDLTRRRPSHRVDVGAQHPERGPHALPVWNADARFDAAVRPCREALRLETRGRVSTTPVPALIRAARRLGECGDHEMAVAIERDIFGARCVE